MYNEITIRKFNENVDFKINKHIEYLAEDSNNYKHYMDIKDKENFLIFTLNGEDVLLIVKEDFNKNNILERFINSDILFFENNLDFRLLKGLLHKQRVESYAEIAKSHIVFTKEYFNLKGENFYEPIEAKNLFDFGFGIINKGKTENLKDNFVAKNDNINFEGNILCAVCKNTILKLGKQ